MTAKPSYIIDLENEVQDIKTCNEESHEKLFKKLNEIHTCLAGTEYDRQNGNAEKGGGVVRRLGRVEKKVSSLQIWRTKTITVTNLVWIVVGGALTAVWSIIIANWDNIFTKPS